MEHEKKENAYDMLLMDVVY